MHEYNGLPVINYGKYEAVKIEWHHLSDKNGYVYVHRLVAEEMLGRPLENKESVHHIDKDKKNNRKENLMIFKTHGDHAAFHRGGTPVLSGDVWECIRKGRTVRKCVCCGKDISKRATYCRNCADMLIHKPHIKSKEDADVLQQYIDSGMSKEAIGRIYGVSGKAVAKWIAKWGISKDICTFENA